MKINIPIRLVFIIPVIFFIYSNLTAQTSIPGGTVSGTWTVSGSPYHIMGSIMVPNDSTLNIEPGVTVNFQGAYKLYVQGRVIAIGIQTDTIHFTCDNTANGWRGIRFENTPENNDTTKFSYCKFQYGKAYGETPEDNGGALYFNNFSKIIIENSRISNCAAWTYGGGIYLIDSNPIITGNIISNNSADRGGGIYCINSNPVISNNNISNNSASRFGAGIYSKNSNSEINNNIISNNSAPNDGGGIHCRDGNSTIVNNTIYNNTAFNGGGILCVLGNSLIDGNTIYNNYASANGGGVYCHNGTVTNNLIFDNSAARCGGLYCSHSQVSNNVISNNHSTESSGGISCWHDCSISFNLITNNSAPKGGGIGSYVNSVITNNTISNNSASYGGGICCDGGSPTISNNIIANDLATSDGGGIYCCNNSLATFTNNVISNNSASDGGGIYCDYSDAKFINNTISNCDANYGGALYCTNESDPTFHNSIIFNNTASISGAQVFLNTENCDPNFYYCNIQGSSLDFGVNDNFYIGIYQNNIDSNPIFIAPSDSSGINYDGITADWSLQNNSPCINAGNTEGTYPETDIIGNPRIVGDTIDIGAYEFQWQENILELLFMKTFSFYPNPAHDMIEVTGIENTRIELVDFKGNILKTINSSRIRETVDISKLSVGVYFIKATTEKGVSVRKLIKQ
jgi:hypothetical protein